MKILVDADACPVKSLIVKHARQKQIPVILVADNSHELNDGYSTVITVDKARDSADIKLANLVCEGDIVVTQDYGVATMAIGRRAMAINQDGLIYSNDNIDSLLSFRHVSAKMRRSGKRTANTKKRTHQNDEAFELAFISLLKG